MHLILDFGNTQQKCSVFKANKLIQLKAFTGITLQNLMNFTSTFPQLRSCILSSVIHTPTEIITWLDQNFFFIALDENTPLPIHNCYKTPNSLGKDRLSAAVGAYTLAKGDNALSIDAGTAIKFDYVNAKGEYLGGSIAPGINLRFKALHNFTAKLPLVEYNSEHHLIGTDTKTSILSGVINGAISEMNGIINQYILDKNNPKIFLSGGESIYFEKYIKSDIFVEPNLVLIGLNEILTFNERTD